MVHYVDIGAQRVQSWMAATPKLTHLRGASHALRNLTGGPAIDAWLAALSLKGVARCVEAGDKDGVVVLTAESEDQAARAARELLSHLASVLPRLAWEGWRVDAASYVAAVAAARRGDRAVRRLSLHPSQHEVPVLDQCDTCRQEPRVRTATGKREQGADCAVREAHAQAPAELLAAIPGAWAQDFQQLSRHGGTPADGSGSAPALGRKDSRNHIALIKADGNKVGAVFEALDAYAGELPSLTQHAVRDLDDATWAAVEQATRAITPASALYKGALPHYVGGDDVLVSVPAARAWEFAATLAREFAVLGDTWRARVAADTADEQLRTRMATVIDEVSLGIGMVIARETYPFAHAFDLAEEAMKAAKKYTRGQSSAIAWVDLSAEGIAGAKRGDRWQQVISAEAVRHQLAEAGDSSADIGFAIMALPAAARAQLAAEIRDAPTSVTAIAAVETWCRRNDRADVIARQGRKDPYALLPILSRARWWPTAAVEEASA